MRSLNEDLLRELAGHDAPLCLSLYLEVAPGGGEHDQIRIALKNAKAAAAAAIGPEDGGDEVRAVRGRLEALDYDDVVGSRERHVAVFIAPDRSEVVSARVDETGVAAGTRFRLAPLVAALEQTPDHAILVATKDRASLFRAHGGRLEAERVEGMPGSLADFEKFTDLQEKGNVKGRETAGISHHSMGGDDWHKDHEDDLRLYANALAKAAGRHLGGTNMPLIVAADERLYGMIREYCEYKHLADQGITQNPDDLDEERLRTEAAACLERAVEKRRAAAWDEVEASLGRGDGRASDDPADIVTAAAAGRVAHLFVRTGARLPGRFDRQTLAAEPAEDGPEDLVDRAIVETLRNGGDVFPLGERGGEGTMLAAAYRYPA